MHKAVTMTEKQTPEMRDITTSGGNYCERVERHHIVAETVNIYETAPNSTAPSINNGKVTASQKQLAFAIAGSFDEVDHAKLKAILALLQKISGDASIEIIRLEEGSIRLILGGSSEGLERLKVLFESGELTELLDVNVEYARFLEDENSDDTKSQELNQTKPSTSRITIIDPLPSEQAGKILCCYVNATSKIQVARISDVPNWYFERIVFPGQRLVFEALRKAHLEIHTGMMASAILLDIIPCERLEISEPEVEGAEEDNGTSVSLPGKRTNNVSRSWGWELTKSPGESRTT